MPDDIVLKFAGRGVGDFKALSSLVGTSDPDETVTIELRRGSETITKKLKLGKWK